MKSDPTGFRWRFEKRSAGTSPSAFCFAPTLAQEKLSPDCQDHLDALEKSPDPLDQFRYLRGLLLKPDDVCVRPAGHQDRTWSSPIGYTPPLVED